MWRAKSRVEWLIALSVVVTLGFCAICASILWEVRRGVSERALQSATNLIAAVQSDITSNIESYDLSLQAVVDGMNAPSVRTLSPEIRQMVLFDRAATARFLGSISLLDETGRLIVDSSTLRPQPNVFADQEYFTVHRDFPSFGLYVKGPVADQLGESAIAISRRLTRSDGSFGGAVVGTLRLAYFQNLFTKLSLGSQSVITLMQADGRVLMRSPYKEAYIGRDIGSSDVFRRVSSVESGSYEGNATIDGVSRIYAFSHIGSLPLIITVGLSTNETYAEWRREALIIGSMMVLLCAVTIALGSVLTRELGRREEAERRLAHLASTDSLTGLSNRRKFDETIVCEWSRAQRSQTPLSLLMIDADLFKAYNDTSGHQAGDQLLLAVAECIAATTKRPADLVTRYGGEEFSVLLPETPVYGARDLAAEIHRHIAALDFSHPTSQTGKPTVSIGVACLVPQPDMEYSQLVQAADTALYEAKKRGRNRTEIAGSGLSDIDHSMPPDAQGRQVA